MSPTFFQQPKKALKNLPEAHPQFLNASFCDPYSGCEFGCLYCYALKEEFADAAAPWPYPIGVKTTCAYAFKNETAPAAGASGPGFSVGIGFATDPYQSCEEQYQVTRRCLEIAREQSVPVQVLTKSERVLRDKGLLSDLSQKGLAAVSVSLFTCREEVSALFEPRAAAPRKRLDLIARLRDAGIVCGVHLMPVFPYLTDSQEELEGIFSQAEACGAQYCVPGILSLSQPVARKRVLDAIHNSFPRLSDPYQALYDGMGRPALNYCQRLDRLFESLAEKHGILLSLPVLMEGRKRSLIVRCP